MNNIVSAINYGRLMGELVADEIVVTQTVVAVEEQQTVVLCLAGKEIPYLRATRINLSLYQPHVIKRADGPVLRFHLLVIRAIVGNDNLPLDGLFAQLLVQRCHQVVTTAVENRYKYGERMVHYKR